MKKRVAIVITLTLLLIVSICIIVRTKAINNSNETFYEETFYEYEETEMGSELDETASENYIPTELK
ncbi:MAG: hypothetical protein K2K96_12865 [Lachnospiraceae bacterium]|nr:hypothetical protein [Lachnospiraceae bacterium]